MTEDIEIKVMGKYKMRDGESRSRRWWEDEGNLLWWERAGAEHRNWYGNFVNAYDEVVGCKGNDENVGCIQEQMNMEKFLR